jgi:hypothetical protein
MWDGVMGDAQVDSSQMAVEELWVLGTRKENWVLCVIQNWGGVCWLPFTGDGWYYWEHSILRFLLHSLIKNWVYSTTYWAFALGYSINLNFRLYGLNL